MKVIEVPISIIKRVFGSAEYPPYRLELLENGDAIWLEKTAFDKSPVFKITAFRDKYADKTLYYYIQSSNKQIWKLIL